MEVEIFVNKEKKEVLIIPGTKVNEAYIRKIEEQFKNFEVEIASLFDLFRKETIKEFLFARSLIDNKMLIEKLGFRIFSEYKYCLDNLDQVSKVLFNYALLGRRGKKGVLHKLNGMKIAKGLVLIPSKNEKPFESFLNKWKISFKKRIVIYEVI